MDVSVLKRNISDKMLMQQKPLKKKIEEKKNRLLITVNVPGSTGPIRFVAKEGDCAAEVIDAALKLYGREKRLPQLGSDVNSFLLYPANAGLDALGPSELIGYQGMRNFILCKKQRLPQMTEARSEMITQQKKSNNMSLKAWFNKSLSFKILSH